MLPEGGFRVSTCGMPTLVPVAMDAVDCVQIGGRVVISEFGQRRPFLTDRISEGTEESLSAHIDASSPSWSTRSCSEATRRVLRFPRYREGSRRIARSFARAVNAQCTFEAALEIRRAWPLPQDEATLGS
jgi:hypothetical protein